MTYCDEPNPTDHNPEPIRCAFKKGHDGPHGWDLDALHGRGGQRRQGRGEVRAVIGNRDDAIAILHDEIERLHAEKDEAQRQEHMAKNAERRLSPKRRNRPMIVFECDHNRPVVRVSLPNGSSSWFHIEHDGYAVGECVAGIYIVTVEAQAHPVSCLVDAGDTP